MNEYMSIHPHEDAAIQRDTARYSFEIHEEWCREGEHGQELCSIHHYADTESGVRRPISASIKQRWPLQVTTIKVIKKLCDSHE